MSFIIGKSDSIFEESDFLDNSILRKIDSPKLRSYESVLALNCLAWSFDNESELPSTELKLKGKAHDDSIRGVQFSRTGSSLFTIGNDKQLLVSDVETGKAVLSITEAFE